MSAMQSATPPPSRTLCLVLALFAGCPVLLNLAGAYIADGATFLFTTGGSLAALALAAGAALLRGIPLRDLATFAGPPLALAVAGGLFWLDWLGTGFVSPSPIDQLRNLAFQGLLWIAVPIALALIWRRSVDTVVVLRWMIVLCTLYVIGLLLRWALGLGYYHSGRWHAGESLEAIRSGRYAALALWVFAVSLLCPAAMIDRRLRWCCLAGIPIAAFLLVATNARGPWLSLAVVVVATAAPIARRLARLIGRDARTLLWLVLGAAGTGMFVLWQVGSVESDFERLFSVTNDGGSAAGRIDLWRDHLGLIGENPLVLLVGAGYAHGLFYPHNILLEALTAGGVPQLLLLLAVFATALWAWLGRSRPGDMPTLLFGGLFLLGLMGAQVSGSVGNEMMPWYGALLLVLRTGETAAERTPT